LQDKKLAMIMLFDFFGELLTEKQREYFDLYYNEDLSLSEIAGDAGISRQGVRDLIVRAENALLEFEKKTGVVERFMALRSSIDGIEADLRRIHDTTTDETVRNTLGGITERLEALKG